MKKIICALALMATAATMSAQDRIVKKVRLNMEEIQNLMANPQRTPKESEKLQQMMAEAITMITPTLNSPETKKEMANAWDIRAKLHMFTFSPEIDHIVAKEPLDTAKLAKELYAALDAKEKAYLAEKDAKEPKFIMGNKLDVIKFRPYVAYCGQMFFQNAQCSQKPADYAKAVDAFKRWMNYPKTYTILGADAAALEQDEQTPQIAYFTCLSAYFAKDYKTLMEYLPQARTYTQEKDQVNQLYLTALIEQGDTLGWLKASKDIVLADPVGNEGITQNVLAYYFNRNDLKAALAFSDELLKQDGDSKLANYAKGAVLMQDNKNQEALPYFEKAIESDPTFSDAYYNAGVCYSNIGYEMNDKLTGKKMTPAQQKAEIDKVKAEYAKAEPFFLKVKELEPENTHKWASRLSTVYYILGNKAKQAEMEKLCE